MALEASSADLFSAQLVLISSHFCETSAFCSPSVLSANFFISSISNGVWLLLAEGGEGFSLPGPEEDVEEDDMAANGLVLHLATALIDVVLLVVAAIEARDIGVIIIAALVFDRRRKSDT